MWSWAPQPSNPPQRPSGISASAEEESTEVTAEIILAEVEQTETVLEEVGVLDEVLPEGSAIPEESATEEISPETVVSTSTDVVIEDSSTEPAVETDLEINQPSSSLTEELIEIHPEEPILETPLVTEEPLDVAETEEIIDSYPVTVRDCVGGGFRHFGFANPGECLSYVR